MLPIYWSGCMKILHRWVTIPCIHEKVEKGVTPLAQTFLKRKALPRKMKSPYSTIFGG